MYVEQIYRGKNQSEFTTRDENPTPDVLLLKE